MMKIITIMKIIIKNNINNNNSNIFPYFDNEFIHIVYFSSHLCFIYDYYYYH